MVQKQFATAVLFVHKPNNTKAPELATYFINQLNKVCGASQEVGAASAGGAVLRRSVSCQLAAVLI